MGAGRLPWHGLVKNRHRNAVFEVSKDRLFASFEARKAFRVAKMVDKYKRQSITNFLPSAQWTNSSETTIPPRRVVRIFFAMALILKKSLGLASNCISLFLKVFMLSKEKLIGATYK